MTGPEFETVLRRALRLRDDQRRARLLDKANYDMADSAFVAEVLAAAGFEVPAAAVKTVAKGKVAQRKNRAAAFGDDDKKGS